MDARKRGPSAPPFAVAIREALGFCGAELREKILKAALWSARLSEPPADPHAAHEFVQKHLRPAVEASAGAASAEEVVRFLEPILRIASPMPPTSGPVSLPISQPISAPRSGEKVKAGARSPTTTPRSDKPSPRADKPLGSRRSDKPSPRADKPSPRADKPLTSPRADKPLTSPRADRPLRSPRSDRPLSSPRSDNAASAPRSGEKRKVDRPAVLIADVSPGDRTALAAFLEAEGYEAVVADTVKSAVALAESKACRIVLCDFGVPGMAGHSLAPQLRRVLGDDAPPIYEMTADAGTSKRATGIAGVLTKPVTPDDVLFLLANVVRRRPER